MEFRVSGLFGGEHVTIAFDGDALADPTGMVARIADRGIMVGVTPTGPWFEAALEPPHVLYLTALEALDVVEAVEVDPELVAALEALAAVPDGAVA